MKTCITCGMPLEGAHENDLGFESPEGPVCRFDSEAGHIKSPEAIFKGGVMFFSGYVDNNEALAERITRKNMKALAYWQAHPSDVLEGPEATDEEYQAVIEKL